MASVAESGPKDSNPVSREPIIPPIQWIPKASRLSSYPKNCLRLVAAQKQIMPAATPIISDPTGTILADKFQAIAHAKRIVRELKDGGGYDAGWALVVTDDDGDEVASLPF